MKTLWKTVLVGLLLAGFSVASASYYVSDHYCPAIAFDPACNCCVVNRIDGVPGFFDMNFR
jgi:hypothetical protein